MLKHVTSRWRVLTLAALYKGTHRFSDLRHKIGGVSEKTFTQSLQALEQDGLLNRTAYPVVPPHVEHSLMPLGERVSEKITALANQIESNLPEVLAVRDECVVQLPDALSLPGLRCMACRTGKTRQHRVHQ